MILYVLRYYPTLSETFVYREIAELLARGVPVVVAALGERGDGALQDERPAVQVLRPPRGLARARALAHPPRTRREVALLRWLAGVQRPKDAVRAAWLVGRARELGVRRVHAHFAGEAAEVARVVAGALEVPYGVTVHAVDLFRPRPALARVLADARPVVTVADHHRRWIADRYGVEAHTVRIGVDPARYGRGLGSEAGEPRPPASPVRISCVARYAPKKGIVRLVDVVEALEGPVSLRLVSDAPAALGSERVTVGPLPPSAVPSVLAASDLFVLPCTVAADGDRDGIPVALLEAMASGLPVVTTAVSGIPELVCDEVGWLLPPDDPRALAETLHTACAPTMEARRELARRGEAARARILARGLTVERQVDGLLAAWEAA